MNGKKNCFVENFYGTRCIFKLTCALHLNLNPYLHLSLDKLRNLVIGNQISSYSKYSISAKNFHILSIMGNIL